MNPFDSSKAIAFLISESQDFHKQGKKEQAVCNGDVVKIIATLAFIVNKT